MTQVYFLNGEFSEFYFFISHVVEFYVTLKNYDVLKVKGAQRILFWYLSADFEEEVELGNFFLKSTF